MTSAKYRAILLLSGILVIGALLVATDSTLTGRVLTRIEANRLADQTGEAGLHIHAIEGRGNNTEVRFIRAGDPVPLAPLKIRRCSPSRCLSTLSSALWGRDVQHEVAVHMLETFDQCGLPPIALPEINLLWGTNGISDQRPLGESLDLNATVLLASAQVEDDTDGFQTLAKACMTRLLQDPTDNPGWHLITDDVSLVLLSVPLITDHVPPAAPPVLEFGPYRKGSDGSLIRKYGHTIEFHLTAKEGTITAGPLSISAPPNMKENHIRTALKPPLLAWLAEIKPHRAAGDFVFRASETEMVDQAAGLARIFVEVTDNRTSEPAIVIALFDLGSLGSPSWQPNGFELVADFGFEPAVDVPFLPFDLEDLPDE